MAYFKIKADAHNRASKLSDKELEAEIQVWIDLKLKERAYLTGLSKETNVTTVKAPKEGGYPTITSITGNLDMMEIVFSDPTGAERFPMDDLYEIFEEFKGRGADDRKPHRASQKSDPWEA